MQEYRSFLLQWQNEYEALDAKCNRLTEQETLLGKWKSITSRGLVISNMTHLLPKLPRPVPKLGVTAFGGPAAHIALMHDEVVLRRKWLTDEQFLDLLGATNLIPGPNSTEMAIHIGYIRAGWAGLLLSGFCFIAPAMLIVLALAWLYVQFGRTPQAEWLLYDIKPVVIAIIAQAI